MFKSNYFRAGYFRAKYFKASKQSCLFSFRSYFNSEVVWTCANRKEEPQQSYPVSEAIVNIKIDNCPPIYIGTFSIDSEEAVSCFDIYDVLQPKPIKPQSLVSCPRIKYRGNNREEEEIILSLILSGEL